MSSMPHVRPAPEAMPIREIVEAWWEMHPDQARFEVADWVFRVTGHQIGELFDAGDDAWFYSKLLEVMHEEDACSIYEGQEAGP